MRRVLNKALGLCLICGLSLAILAGTFKAAGATVPLPDAQRAELNAWLTPPTDGMRVTAADFPDGHIMGHLINWFAGKDKPAFILGIYYFEVEPGLFTSLKKAPPQSFHQIKGFWLAGDPYSGMAEGDERVQWQYSDPSYAGYDFKCENYGARINFRISPDSKGRELFLVVLSAQPGMPMSIMLKSPGTPDAQVGEYGSYPPWCPDSQGSVWGNVLTRYPMVIPAPKAKPVAELPAEEDCSQGCKGRLAMKRTQRGQALPSNLGGEDCPQGFRQIQTAKDRTECLGCDPGKSLVVLGSNNGTKEVACLQCPEGYRTVMMQREAGKYEAGQAWSKDSYACLQCPPGYQLIFPKMQRGNRPDGTQFIAREASCWRCPEGTAMKEESESSKLPDGSTLQSKTYTCQ